MNKAIFAINSSIGQADQGIVVNQALIEFKQRGLLKKVYCSAKGGYILEDLPLETVSLPSRLSSLLLRMLYLRNKKAGRRWVEEMFIWDLVAKRCIEAYTR